MASQGFDRGNVVDMFVGDKDSGERVGGTTGILQAGEDLTLREPGIDKE